MTAQIVFDTAVINDAVQKAARIAPLKGAGAEKAAGILIEVDPVKRLGLVKATDLEVSYIQRIPATEGSGDAASWRIPSVVLSTLLSGLPQGDGSTTKFDDRGDGKIRISSGTTYTAFNVLPAADFPKVAPFDRSDLTEANQFAAKANRVSWACDMKNKGPMAGVHLDTEHLIGCSNSTVAVMPCEVGLEDPITVPLGALESLLKGGSDVHIAPEADKFYVKLDAETYATSTLIESPYPDVKQVFREDFVGTVEVHRGSILESLNRLQAMIKAEREMPTLILELRTDGFVPQLIFDIEVPELGRMQDSIHVTTEFAEDDPFSIGFAPHMLINALEHTEGNKIYIDFGNSTTRDRDKRSSLRIRDETGFFSYVSPKVIKND